MGLAANRHRILLDYVIHHYCNRILEIVVCHGDTAEELLRYSSNQQVEYYGVDLFEDATPELIASESSMEPWPEWRVAKRLPGTHWSLFKGFSKDVLPKLARLDFDMVWIDGGHSYETVKSDLAMTLPMLADSGVIFLDDYTSDPLIIGVKKLVDELIADKGNGLEVQIHYNPKDFYRGHDFLVASVRKQKGIKSA